MFRTLADKNAIEGVGRDPMKLDKKPRLCAQKFVWFLPPKDYDKTVAHLGTDILQLFLISNSLNIIS